MDIKPVINWAQKNGEAKVVERLLVRVLPDLLEQNIQITAESLNNTHSFEVPDGLYRKFQMVAEELVGKEYIES